MRIAETSVVRASGNVVSCRLSDGKALLDLNTNTYFSLNGIGSQVWDMLQTPIMVGDIRDALLASFDVDTETCTRDLVAMLQQLVDADLVAFEDAARR